MLPERHFGKPLVVLAKPRAHSRAAHIPQRLMLQERMLAEEIRLLQREHKEVRERIRQALNHGAKCEPGFRTAAIATRHVLQVR